MLLTRIVLFEKILSLSDCRNPMSVSDGLWKKISIEFPVLRFEQTAEFIANKILSPMLKIDNFSISPTYYDPNDFTPYRKIIFGPHLIFELNIETIRDTHNFCFENSLKEYVIAIWEKADNYNRGSYVYNERVYNL